MVAILTDIYGNALRSPYDNTKYLQAYRKRK